MFVMGISSTVMVNAFPTALGKNWPPGWSRFSSNTSRIPAPLSITVAVKSSGGVMSCVELLVTALSVKLGASLPSSSSIACVSFDALGSA